MRQQIAFRALRISAALMLAGLFVQLFTAGVAAVTDPGWWAYHLAAIHYSQWLVVPLPVFAALGGRRYRVRRSILAGIPVVQIGLQYMLAHRAMDGRLPIGIGLHAVNAGIMLIILACLALGTYAPAANVAERSALPDR